MSDFYEEVVTGSVSSDQMSGKLDNGSSHGSIIYPYESFDAFPEKGRRKALYIDTSQIPNKLYRWDVNSSSYVPIGDGDSDGEVPETLPNPHALSFTGAVKTAYDGSRPVSVNIPSSESIDHSKLQNRGATNQHPISAIAGLSPILESLEDGLSEVKGQISSPFNFKGSIDSSELPETAEVNDTYYCTDLKYRVTWNGSEWAQSSSPEAEFTDELIDARKGADGVTYTTAGGAVRGQLQGAHKDIANTSKYADFIAKYGSDHFYPIVTSSSHPVTRWEQPGTEITAFSPVAGTDYIKCPKYLCIDFPDDVSRCYLYFYKLIDGEFVANWDLLSFPTGAKVLNYIRNGIVESNMIEIPDDMYMQIAVVVGEVNFYGWDGLPAGVPLSADVSIPVESQTDFEYAFSTDGSFGVTVPGNAKYFACANGAHFAMGIAVKEKAVTVINTATASKNFIALPEDYDFFNFRVFCNNGECITGDVSRIAIAITPEAVESRRASAHAKEVLALCDKVNSLPWAVMSELPAYLFNDVENGIITSTSKGAAYKAGVKYNGLPYCSNWEIAHYVGWHITPHTFINAANDPDSIFYHERVLSWDKKQESVYYGTVCSAFGTMVNGWDYPQTNAGFVYDPDIDVMEAKTPPIGNLYSNLVDHCLIPQRVDIFENGTVAVNAHEGVRPLSRRTSRYSTVDIDSDISGFNSYYGKGYYDNYGYAVSYKKANGNVPYADFDDTDIVGGCARPYKGDKSVYTNNEPVLINIKSGNTLTLKKDGESQTIDVTGLPQIDVTEYLNGDGIYYVSTDADENDIEESFEYHKVEPITYNIKNGRILFSSSDFWYAACYLEGFPLFTDATGKLQSKVCCVPSREDNDYRDWMKEGVFTGATVAFRKGTYGAYVVPLELGDVEDIVPDDSTGGTYDYDLLKNKPKINGVVLEGDVSAEELGIEAKITIDSELSNASKNPVENKAISSALDSLKIIGNVNGTSVVINDASDENLCGMTLYGKTTQDGMPTPENPIPLVSAGNSGNITVSVSNKDSSKIQTLTVQTPNGLHGVPVTSGGNYTDENDQQWVCDEIDFERGVYVQKIQKIVFDGSADEQWQVSSALAGRYIITVAECKPDSEALSSHSIGHLFNSSVQGEHYISASKQFVINTPFFTLNEWLSNISACPLTVLFVAESEIETPLTAEEIAAYKALHTYKSVTTILNDGGVNMDITYVPNTPSAIYLNRQLNDIKSAILSLGGNI